VSLGEEENGIKLVEAEEANVLAELTSPMFRGLTSAGYQRLFIV
jgi:hypothetical protein